MYYPQFEIQVDDWRINTVLGGSGPLLLFIHGLGASAEWWTPSLDRFAPHYTVCAIDLPGSGQSSDLTEQPAPGRFSKLVETVIATVNRGPAIVIGHSLGGFVSVQAAISRTPSIRGLALIAPAGFGPVENVLMRALTVPNMGEQLVRLGTSGMRLLMHSMVHQHSLVTDQLLDSVTLDGRAQQQFLLQLRMGMWVGGARPGLIFTDQLRLAAPVWLAWGIHDSVFPVSTGERASQILSVPPPTWYLKSGHIPQLEEPETFHAALTRFIESIVP